MENENPEENHINFVGQKSFPQLQQNTTAAQRHKPKSKRIQIE